MQGDDAFQGFMLSRLMITILIAGIVTFFTTPRIIRFCIKRGLLVKPDARKCHTCAVPQLGGVAVYIGFFVALLLAFPFIRDSLVAYPKYVYYVLGTVIAAGFCFVMGLFDDLFSLRPIWKFIFQISIAASLVVFGVRIEFLTRPGNGMLFLPIIVSAIITIFWVISVMNAINLTDGLDGLAGGISLIAGIVFLAIAVMRPDPIKAQMPAFLSAAMIGSIIGFLPYNFPRAKIFLGDSGSQFLGFLLASISILGAFKTPTFFALIIPVMVLGIPLLDTSLAILRRSLSGKKIYEADTGHIHYTLVKLGLSPNQAVLILCAITAVLGVLAFRFSSS